MSSIMDNYYKDSYTNRIQLYDNNNYNYNYMQISYNDNILVVSNNKKNNISLYKDRKYIKKINKINCKYSPLLIDENKIFYVTNFNMCLSTLDNEYNIIESSLIYCIQVFQPIRLIYNKFNSELIIAEDSLLTKISENGIITRYQFNRNINYKCIVSARYDNLLYYIDYNGSINIIDNGNLYKICDGPNGVSGNFINIDDYNNIIYVDNKRSEFYHKINIFNCSTLKNEYNFTINNTIKSNIIYNENEFIYIDKLNNINYVNFNGRNYK